MEGGPLGYKFQLAQFHFHWGKTSKTGSEHRLNGQSYAAEVNGSPHLLNFSKSFAIATLIPISVSDEPVALRAARIAFHRDDSTSSAAFETEPEHISRSLRSKCAFCRTCRVFFLSFRCTSYITTVTSSAVSQTQLQKRTDWQCWEPSLRYDHLNNFDAVYFGGKLLEFYVRAGEREMLFGKS